MPWPGDGWSMGMGYSKSAAGRLYTGFDLRKPNRIVGGDEVGGHGIDGFWVNFRQEDRICRKEVKKNLKLETGNRRGSGELLVTGGW